MIKLGYSGQTGSGSCCDSWLEAWLHVKALWVHIRAAGSGLKNEKKSDNGSKIQLRVNMDEIRGEIKGCNVIHLHLAAMTKAVSGLAEAEWRHLGSIKHCLAQHSGDLGAGYMLTPCCWTLIEAIGKERSFKQWPDRRRMKKTFFLILCGKFKTNHQTASKYNVWWTTQIVTTDRMLSHLLSMSPLMLATWTFTSNKPKKSSRCPGKQQIVAIKELSWQKYCVFRKTQCQNFVAKL